VPPAAARSRRRRAAASLTHFKHRPATKPSGLTNLLEGFSGTLLAPTDAAITAAAVSAKGSLQALLDDKALLEDILKNHVRVHEGLQCCMGRGGSCFGVAVQHARAARAAPF